ncbi:MAG: Maf family protein [Clostridiales bacterium]|nr:Maf family protein [Clostridiales bacterium]
MPTKQIILASSSPRRIQMMKERGFDPVIITPDVDETVPEGAKPHVAVMFLALKKALYVEGVALERGYANGETVIAADTTVVWGGCMIGKPENPKEAFDILKKLCGNPHLVLTGVAVLKTGSTDRKVFYETSKVFFKEYTDEEIIAYANTKEPYDKAGGYAIQGTWGKHVDRIEGDRDNIMGFPWARIFPHLQIT